MNDADGLPERTGRARCPRADAALVSVETFVRAETDTYFAEFVRGAGLGRFAHRREPTAIEHQDVVRMSLDSCG